MILASCWRMAYAVSRRQRRPSALRALALCTACTLAFGVVAAGVASAGTPASHAATPVAEHSHVPFGSPADCPGTTSGPSFSSAPTGTFATCLRVGPLAPGHYHVVVKGYLTVPRPVRGSVPSPTRVHLTIHPAMGGPGTRVTVRGVVPEPVSRATTFGQICWDGCGRSLQITTTKHWTSTTTFVEHFRVPSAPWVTSSRVATFRIAPLRSGSYEVGVDCVVFARGCAGLTEGSAIFRLVVGPHESHRLCTSARPATCAYIQLAQDASRPGAAVRVRGFVPLTTGLLSLEVLPGHAHGPAVALLLEPKGGSFLRYGQADLTVGPAPTFSSLATIAVSGEQFDGPAPVSENPTAPGRLAWCGQGSIGLVRANGAAIADVPTTGVPSVLAGAGIGYGLYPPTDACRDVALPTAGPALFAAFEVAVTPTRTVDSYVALETTDGGKSWSLVPPPLGARATGFGGFHYQDGRVIALFAPGSPKDRYTEHVTPPVVESYDSATGRWVHTSLECMKEGPCTTFGSALPGNCAMNGTTQSLLVSTDGGRLWRAPEWPSSVNGCASSSIVVTGSSDELLVNGSVTFPILRSDDGGTHWSSVVLPKPPFTLGGLGPRTTILSDGAVLAIRATRAEWALLAPRATRWCRVRSVPERVRGSLGTSSLALFSTALWWVGSATGKSPTSIRRVEVSRIRC